MPPRCSHRNALFQSISLIDLCKLKFVNKNQIVWDRRRHKKCFLEDDYACDGPASNHLSFGLRSYFLTHFLHFLITITFPSLPPSCPPFLPHLSHCYRSLLNRVSREGEIPCRGALFMRARTDKVARTLCCS